MSIFCPNLYQSTYLFLSPPLSLQQTGFPFAFKVSRPPSNWPICHCQWNRGTAIRFVLSPSFYSILLCGSLSFLYFFIFPSITFISPLSPSLLLVQKQYCNVFSLSFFVFFSSYIFFSCFLFFSVVC